MEVSWQECRGGVVLVVRGLPAGAAGTPRVYPTAVLGDGHRPVRHQAMAGRWEASGDHVAFVPRFPFLPDTGYAVVVDGEHPVATLRTPPVGGEPLTSVVAIEPALAVVPRNLLRFHVSFSSPMGERQAGRFVRLEQVATGAVLAGSLLSMDPELWDAGHRRLTVLLDPARLKRGLAPHLEAGYPLAEGDEVRLVVDEGFPDAEGRGLRAAAGAPFRVGPDLRGRVRPAVWAVAAPAAGTRRPLRIRFERPLDRPLVERCLRVVDLAGTGTAGPDGLQWEFVPDRPWVPGVVRVVVDPSLEDVAGNSVTRVFDRNLEDPADDPIDPADAPVLTVEVPRH